MLSAADGNRSGFDFVHDAYGRVIEKRGRCFDKTPCGGSSGVAIERISYDRRGWEVERRFFGEDAKPVADGRGVHAARSDYGDFGKVIRRCTLGLDNKPVAANGRSPACGEYKYNERNLLVEIRYFDATGAPTGNAPDVCTSERNRFDDWGRAIAWYCHGKDGEPIVRQPGSYYSWTSTYDAWGNGLDVAYFDVKGQRTVRVGGGHRISRWNREYDTRSRVVRERYFDVNDKPVADDQGVHEI